jgi:hypothetical protein
MIKNSIIIPPDLNAGFSVNIRLGGGGALIIFTVLKNVSSLLKECSRVYHSTFSLLSDI